MDHHHRENKVFNNQLLSPMIAALAMSLSSALVIGMPYDYVIKNNHDLPLIRMSA